MNLRSTFGRAIVSGLLLAACGDSEGLGGSGGGGSGGGATGGNGTGAGTTGGSGTGAGATGGGATGGGGAGPALVGRCGDPAPQGAPTPDPVPSYGGGTCPALAAGPNTLPSSGSDRAFLLVLPQDYDASKSYPLVFMWHWLGGSADEFFQRAEVQAACDTQQFIAVLPEKKGDLTFTWPFDITVSSARVDEELAFFDDLYACVAEQYSVDTSCAASVGVSAGALWTDQLAHRRSTHLSSFVSLSGGTGGVVQPWATPEHRLPGLVLWGGDTDTCQGLLSFKNLSNDLETHLTADGHFFLECIHNCGHSEPPFEGPMGFSKYKGMWDFVLDHPYWVSPGASVYQSEGLSPDLPEWCAIGQGNATERTGVCVDPSQC